MRHKSKFYLVWGLLLGLAIFGSCLEYLRTFGFSDLNAFAEFVMPTVIGAGLFISSIVGVRAYVSRSNTSYIEDKSSEPKSPSKITHCRQCKKSLERYLGVICGLCKGIRCECGACFCGNGSLVRRK